MHSTVIHSLWQRKRRTLVPIFANGVHTALKQIMPDRSILFAGEVKVPSSR